jgi:hypothetical protein
MSATFLVDPRTFPGSVDGVAWGEERLALDFAGHVLSIEGLSARQRERAEDLYRDFRSVTAASFAARVQVFRADPAAFRKIDTRGWSYELDFDYRSDSTLLTGMDWIGRIEWGTSLAGALWVTTEEPGTFHGAFENFLRVLVAHTLLFEGGALVHSAAVLSPAGGRLFVGPSGAGKSTVSRLALDSGRAVVSDDLNLVAPDFSLAGSPFFGDVGSRTDGRRPLVGIYRLIQGSSDEIRVLGEGEALAALVACSPFVNRSAHLEERLFRNLSSLSRTVPAYALTFRREGTFWPLLESC